MNLTHFTMRFGVNRFARSKRGSGLVELMVAVVIMNIIATGIISMLLDMGTLSQKTTNKIDSINSARNALERISSDVRQGRSLGDVFGNQVTLQAATGTTPAIQGVVGTDRFPSTLNPVYGAGEIPPGGWPWTGPPYALSGETLIVQVPIFDAGGFPTAIPAGAGSPAAATVQENVETHIYRIVPDPDQVTHPGEFVMQLSRIAGRAAADYVPTDINSRPQTIVSGIVGPFGNDGALNVFQYLDKTEAAGTPRDTAVDPSRVANLTGVIVNLEVRRNDASARQAQALALKSEIFLRNNAMATTVGQPTSLVR